MSLAFTLVSTYSYAIVSLSDVSRGIEASFVPRDVSQGIEASFIPRDVSRRGGLRLASSPEMSAGGIEASFVPRDVSRGD